MDRPRDSPSTTPLEGAATLSAPAPADVRPSPSSSPPHPEPEFSKDGEYAPVSPGEIAALFKMHGY